MQRHRGFTLIEIMVVVAIIAILAAIALPSYLKYVQRGRRSYAYDALTAEQSALERCYAATFTYSGCPSITSTSFAPPAPQTSYYMITAVTTAPPAAPTYALTAVTQGAQTGDTTCATLTLNSAGVRSAKNSGGADTTNSCY